MTVDRQATQSGGSDGHNPSGSNAAQAQSHQIETNVIKTMVLVCAFYAILWLPEKIFILLAGLNISLNKLNNVYYVAMFLGFLYICANSFIYATKFDPVRRILKGLILCKNESGPAAATGGIQITVRSAQVNQNVQATTRKTAVLPTYTLSHTTKGNVY